MKPAALDLLRELVNGFHEFGDRAIASKSLDDARPYLQALGESVDRAAAFLADLETHPNGVVSTDEQVCVACDHRLAVEIQPDSLVACHFCGAPLVREQVVAVVQNLVPPLLAKELYPDPLEERSG